MFRLYDKEEKKWINKDIYLASNEDLFIFKRTWFGIKKLSLVSSERYIYQKDIGLDDCNGVLIYEGDICKFKETDVTGIVAYYPEHTSYYMFDYDKSTFYILNIESCKHIEVVGNVFDNKELIPSL